MATLTLTFLGSFQATLDGVPIARFRSDKVRGLLAYLAVEAEWPHSRASLCGLLWPDQSDDVALQNLSQTLHRLREALDDTRGATSFLRISRQSVQWNTASDYRLDAADFVRLASGRAAADLEQAAVLYRGELLAGFSLPGSVAFEEWLLLLRERFAHLALTTLEALTRAQLEEGRYEAAAQQARRQLELEPWREAAHRQLMQALAASGDRAAALNAYARYRQVLREELGIEPDEQTRALYERIRTESSSELRVKSFELPAPQLLTQNSHNLPAQLTSFIGREAQLADLRQTLGRARLITLTGAGGCGKTRLALELAAASLPTYADGVWLVALEPLRDPALAPQAVAVALGVQTASDQGVSHLLSAALRPKQLLLVLDNCEHLVAACRQLAEQLLHDCPRLTILAASREMLRIEGEVVWLVPPLSAPDGEGATPDQLLGYEGVRLFVERARAVSAGFALTARNAPAVVQICRQLDSMPLALELAAARVRHMDVETIAARLDDRFSLLRAGSHSVQRQQTLSATIDWSFALLAEPERMCFRRLAVFAGSFTLPFAEEVLGDPPEPNERGASTIELLAQLIDKSLVVAEQHNDGVRYRMLETIRAYAQEQLFTAGEAAAMRDRHLVCFTRLAEEAEPHLFSADQVAWLNTLATEHNNLRAALDWAVERADASAALRLVTALRSFWYTRGHYEEGQRRTLQMLAMPAAQVRTTARAGALNAAAALLWASGDADAALPLLDEALAIGREIGDLWNTGWALLHQGTIAYRQGDDTSARPLLEDGLASCRAAGPSGRRGVGWGLIFLGDLALDAGDSKGARARFAEGVDLLREISDYGLLAYPLRRLGHLALQEGDFEAAKALCTESLRLNQAIEDRLAVVACLAGHAGIAAAEGRAAGVEQRFGHLRHAAQLCGAVAAQLEVIGAPLWPADAAAIERVAIALKDQLGEAAFVTAWAAGRTMSIEQLLAQATGGSPDHPAQPSTPLHNLPAPLTPCIGRNTELAELVALIQKPEVRILSLVGVGGMGKTRLAQELGQSALAIFEDGVCFVPLAPLAAASAIVPAILAALGEQPGSGDPRQALLQILRAKRLVLILDNFEHLLDGAEIVTDILQSAPQVRIIATSRERLHLRGEHQYLLQGLAFAPGASLAEAADAPAVRLFVERAQRVQPSFVVNSTNLGSVLRICQLVEGMPLGIELAATWVETLSPSEIATEIEQNADFLAAEWRDLPERQRSMRAVFDWSWNLLSDGERQAFKQLAIFRGGFTRQAAQAVAGALLMVLTRLVHKALVRLNVSNEGAGRYELHELLRQFALEHLNRGLGDDAAVAERHALFFLELAERIGPAASNDEQEAWLAQITDEHDNIRAALAYCLEARSRGRDARSCGDDHTSLEPGRPLGPSSLTEIGLRLAAAVWPFWQRHCHLSEGRVWLERFLDGTTSEVVAPAVRATALYGAGWLAHDQDDFASADAFFSEGLQIDQALGQTGRVAAVLAHRGITARGQGQYVEAIALLEESLALARAAKDQAGIAYALFRLGVVTRECGQFARSTALYQECLTTYCALGDRSGEGFVLLGLGDIARDQGNAAQVQAYSAEGLAIGRALEQPWITGFALNNLALAAYMQGDLGRAAALAQEALILFRTHSIRGGEVELLITCGQIANARGEIEQAWINLVEGVKRGWPAGPHWLVATALEELARIMGNTRDAVRLYAATTAWRAAMGAPLPQYRRAAYEASTVAIRHALDDTQFATAWAEGAAWPPAQAVAVILDTAFAIRANAIST